MRNFTNPLTFDTLQAFTRPVSDNHYEHPALIDGTACACNGQVAIRCHRGLWAADDFTATHPSFSLYFSVIPFHLFPKDAEFHPMDDHRGHIYRRAAIAPFTRTGTFTPTPGVRLDGIMVPLSMLQLVARLPHCEFTTEPTAAAKPILFFRFSGGIGALASSDHATPAFTITTRRTHYDGTPVTRSTCGNLPLRNWPPVDMTDA